MRLLFLSMFLFTLMLPARAAESIELPEYAWTFSGPLGKFDQQQLQRGFQIYREVCSTCHSLSFIAFRNLGDLGYNEDEIKAIASSYEIKDGPNDAGEMFTRPGRPSDHFPDPFPNRKAAEAANNGAYPPDLSLMSKARHGGADYLKALLMGYTEAPSGFDLADGQYYNRFMAGHRIAMAAPLLDGAVDYKDGSPNTLDQYTTDIAAFLTWTAEPYMIQRKETGLRVMLYVAFMTFIFYLNYRLVKRRVKGA
jgi:ubiquinol-cytochrome c reductase cytochrome c1 subunit